MWLSELHGRLEQILREHGDMQVVRHRSLKIDGIIGTELDNFIDYNSECIGVIEEYKQTPYSHGVVLEKKVGQKLVIDVPL